MKVVEAIDQAKWLTDALFSAGDTAKPTDCIVFEHEKVRVSSVDRDAVVDILARALIIGPARVAYTPSTKEKSCPAETP